MTTVGDGFLTADRVRSTYARCYRDEGWKPYKATSVDGVMFRHTFSIQALHTNREAVIRILLSLPSGFRVDERGGGSMAMMNQRDDKTVWTDDVSDVEKLIALGLASGLLSYCAPREKWGSLPDGLPYLRVEITRFGVSVN
jgi:hypothetical protein